MTTRASSILLLTVAATVGSAHPASLEAQASTSAEDARILALIQGIREAEPRITLDGQGGDWGPVPAIGDVAGDAGGDRRRDIVGVAVLPLRDVLLVRIETQAPPSRADRAFWLNLDLGGTRVAEIQVGLSPDGSHFVRRFDEAGAARGIRRMPFPVAMSEVVEVAFPRAVLEAALGGNDPASGVEALRRLEERSWVRVVAFTWDRTSGAFTDFASAASYRIVADPGPLDAALPPRPAPPTPLDFPLAGPWMVSQGAFGSGSHNDIWAYDLSRSDEGLRWESPEGSCANEDFFSWDQPVTAPAPGRVVRSANSRPDADPCRRDGEGGGNEVYLDVGGDVGVWMAHLRRGSVEVATGEEVSPGTLLGRVGNSGRSTGPHLHLGAYRLSDGQTTLPLSFRNVRVGLNPVPDDPWARELLLWEPRDGMMVEALGERDRP